MRGGAVDAGGARRFVQHVLEREGVAADVLDDAVLGASELATNAIRHAGGIVAVRVAVSDPSVRVEVEDGSTDVVVRRHPGPLDTSGRGLLIIDGLASRWGADASSDGGKVVWFELDRPPGRGASLAADLGEPELARGGRPLVVAASIAALVAGVVIAQRTSGSMDSELAVGLWTAALAVVVTTIGGFRAGVAAAVGLAVGTLVFHREADDVSAELLALGVGIGAVFVAFFAWAGMELRAQSRAEARLLRRLTAFGEALTAIDDSEDPVAQIERLAAEAAEARRAEILPTLPAVAQSVASNGVVVLPLEGPQRHRALALRLPRPSARVPSEERQAFYRSIADRCAQVLERLELRQAERRARADLEVLADASQVLVGSLDVDKVTTALRDVLVPRLADELEVAVLEPGRSETPRVVAPRDGDVVQFDLRSRNRTIGQLTAVRHGGLFDDDDRTLLAEVATRAAAALDNAVLYAEQLATNRILESSLLPTAFRSVDHLDVGARYLASAGSHQVGGDFYDVLPTPQGDMVLIVGDVQGKGVEAATLTALARHTLRAAALAGIGPAAMLDRLNLALRWQQAERELAEDDPLIRFVTAAVAVLHPTPTGFRATVSRGGHPLPIIVRPAGQVEQLAPAGTILGAFEDPGCTEVSVDLGLSDTLVLFTDGVVEHRAAADLFDELQLGRLLRNQLTATGADDLARIILDTVVSLAPTESRDDIAILVTRVTGPR